MAHPETQTGEVWLHNTREEPPSTPRFRTLRLGIIAYDQKGRIASGFRPLFIQLTEARSNNLPIPDQDGSGMAFVDGGQP